jgi:hypothetical protein
MEPHNDEMHLAKSTTAKWTASPSEVISVFNRPEEAWGK